MSCKVCGSFSVEKFDAEMNVHFPGYANLTKPTVKISPTIVICRDCGFAEFQVPKTELRQLDERVAGTGTDGTST